MMKPTRCYRVRAAKATNCPRNIVFVAVMKACSCTTDDRLLSSVEACDIVGGLFNGVTWIGGRSCRSCGTGHRSLWAVHQRAYRVIFNGVHGRLKAWAHEDRLKSVLLLRLLHALPAGIRIVLRHALRNLRRTRTQVLLINPPLLVHDKR